MTSNDPYRNGNHGTDTWKCPKCQTVNNNEYCCNCGQARSAATGTVVCYCGYRNAADAKFCGSCGKSLKKKQPNRKIFVLCLVVILLLSILLPTVRNRHTHQWEKATCSAPMTCKDCGETSGSPLEHDWVAPTCTVAKYCSLCKATTGIPLGHKWKNATIDTPKTCTVCGATSGEKLKSGYLGDITGHTEQVTLRDGYTTLNLHALILDKKVENCKNLTVNMHVEMHAGTSCKDWQLWGRTNGSFRKIAKIYLPDGNGDTSQVITFDKPVSFDAAVIAPTIPGGYSWGLWFEITDVWVDE